jgi:glucokinase
MTSTNGDSLLIADVGGTKVVLALAEPQDGFQSLIEIRTYASREHTSFNDILDDYLAATRAAPSLAVLAVAGPIANGRTRITNLPWEILCDRSIEQVHGIATVTLLNDLESTAWSIPFAASSDLVTLQPGVREPEGSIAVVAPGTGLGEAFLTWDGMSYRAHATEGGHTDFAPQGPEQDRLMAAFRRDYEHVSVERVCSGGGIGNIYRYLAQEEGNVEIPSVQANIAVAEDITPVVVAAALTAESPLCVRAVRLFADILAAEAGNFALKTLATGGVVLAGGLPRRLLPFLETEAFLDRFTAKGRFSDWLRRMPLSILQDPLAPLHGAAAYAASFLLGTRSDTPAEARR